MTRQSLKSVVAGEVRAEMGRQRKTGADLAQVLGVSKQAASRRLKEETEIGLDELEAIAGWLDVPFAQLLGMAHPMQATG
jgi:transcriptional regulator with XRE-family HTH domain